MGKNRARRFGNLRTNPTGLLSEKDIELSADQQQTSAVPSTITSIVEKLQASSAEERTCGCQLLASIVSQPKAIGYLLQQNVIKIAAPLFLDSCSDVRKSALGALRNMSIYGQAEVCDLMVAQDVLTPLTALIKQYDCPWAPEKKSMKYDTVEAVLIEAIELLSNLCESNNTAVHWFNKEDLLKVLLPHLKVEACSYRLSIVIARCLHVVSENNSDVSCVCRQADIFSELLNIVSSVPSDVDGVLLRTLVTGILLNLTEVDLTPYYKGIVTNIAEVLNMDSVSVITAALNGIQEPAEFKDLNVESEISWPEVNNLLHAQSICLELLANLCCSDDDWEEVEGRESSESSDDQAVEASVDMEDTAVSLCLPSEIISAFVEKDIFSTILKKASPHDLALRSQLHTSQPGTTTLKKLQDLQSRALLCLSNMVGAIDDSYLTQLVSLSNIWSELYKLASSPQDTLNEDFTWAITSAMRAVIHRLAENQGSNQLNDVSSSDLDFLVNLAKERKNRETQINVVRILSTIGCYLCNNLQPHPLLKKIGSILADVACHTEDLVLASEALDSLFDVFKEDQMDHVVQEIGLVDKLIALQPSFKHRISRHRKLLGDNYAVVMMAKSNLARYIKYKQSLK